MLILEIAGGLLLMFALIGLGLEAETAGHSGGLGGWVLMGLLGLAAYVFVRLT